MTVTLDEWEKIMSAVDETMSSSHSPITHTTSTNSCAAPKQALLEAVSEVNTTATVEEPINMSTLDNTDTGSVKVQDNGDEKDEDMAPPLKKAKFL